MLAFNEQHGSKLVLPEHFGWTKIPDVAPWRYRETNSFDGASYGAPVAMVADADFAFGVRPAWYQSHPHIATSMLLYLRQFRRELKFPGVIDEHKAKAGKLAFRQHCTHCHGAYEAGYVGYRERVVPLSVVGTDAARVDAVTAEFVAVAQAAPETRGLVVTKRSGGYVPRPLNDVWARGVYGHNGQWPDLATLALPPEQRPRRFVVDLDSPLNLERVGVTWSTAGDASQAGRYLYDAGEPGYGVGGHTFLSVLSAEKQSAIIEYLKTL